MSPSSRQHAKSRRNCGRGRAPGVSPTIGAAPLIGATCAATAGADAPTPRAFEFTKEIGLPDGHRSHLETATAVASPNHPWREFGSTIYRLSMVTVSDPRCPGGCRSLRGRAILHKTVTATGVDIGDALSAAAYRTRRGIPLPRLLRHGRAAVRWVNVWVDVGLCVRRFRPDDYCQNTQATDQSALHGLPLLDYRCESTLTRVNVNVRDCAG